MSKLFCQSHPIVGSNNLFMCREVVVDLLNLFWHLYQVSPLTGTGVVERQLYDMSSKKSLIGAGFEPMTLLPSRHPTYLTLSTSCFRVYHRFCEIQDIPTKKSTMTYDELRSIVAKYPDLCKCTELKVILCI